MLNLASGPYPNGIAVSTIPQRELDPGKPWGLYLKTPEVYTSLVRGGALTELRQLASSRIGIQTLAGGFYILSRQRLQNCGIPKAYVQPLAFSPRDFGCPTIESEGDVRHYVLYVETEKDEISEPAVRRYIDDAEKQLVPIRGKGKTVVGYHNLPRLQKARRNPWYNLATEIQRRGRYSILLPRRFYEEFVVIWNQARVVANENFIELEPYDEAWIKPMLAFFNSSYFELIARSHAQLYGGGVYNLNPADVPNLPFLNVRRLTEPQIGELVEAYDKFANSSKEEGRTILDACLRQSLLLTNIELPEVREAVLQLREISRRAKRYSGVTSRQTGDSLFE